MRLKNKEIRGITMIALVITIVVLLILAGISVAALTGDNGIIAQARNAKEEAGIADEKEIIIQAITEASGKNRYGNLELNQLQTILDNYAEDMSTTIYEESDNFIIIFEDSKRYYITNSDGNITYNSKIDIEDSNIDKLATGIYGVKLEDEKIAIVNTALNKVSYTKLWDGSIATSFETGDGSESNPYIIKNAEQLAYFAQYVNDGNTTSGKYFELDSDIVLNWNVLDDNFNLNSGGNYKTWTPIGFGGLENGKQFYGHFIGNNHIISGMYQTRVNNNYQGLFGCVGITNKSGIEIKNFGIVDSYVYAYQGGGVFGYACANVSNCFVSGNIGGKYFYGGITAYTRGANFTNVFVEGTSNKIYGSGNLATRENCFIASVDYTLEDFMKDYMNN